MSGLYKEPFRIQYRVIRSPSVTHRNLRNKIPLLELETSFPQIKMVMIRGIIIPMVITKM